tara:strand:- start:1488 stop:2162 length:675 start_codon:yes stop_codon:yes gene_type:complete
MFNSPEYSYSKTQQHIFDVYILGLKLGRLNYAIEVKNDLYSASGHLRSTGIFSAISKYSFKASSKGKIESGLFRPDYYSERSDTGRRKEEKTMQYSKQGIDLNIKKTPKPYWQDPDKQSDTLDPMSSIIYILRDQKEANICRQNFAMFDGIRRVKIKFTHGEEASDGQFTCHGIYSRIGGYTEKELKDGTDFPFNVNYKIKNATYKVFAFEITTNRGRAKFVRK